MCPSLFGRENATKKKLLFPFETSIKYSAQNESDLVLEETGPIYS